MNIKKLRKAKGWTQTELANKIGTIQKVIADYENETSKPPVDRLAILAKCFHVSADSILGIGELELPLESSQKNHGNTRANKLKTMFEKLRPEDQRAVVKHVKGLVAQT